jgi:hypothetical protein
VDPEPPADPFSNAAGLLLREEEEIPGQVIPLRRYRRAELRDGEGRQVAVQARPGRGAGEVGPPPAGFQDTLKNRAVDHHGWCVGRSNPCPPRTMPRQARTCLATAMLTPDPPPTPFVRMSMALRTAGTTIGPRSAAPMIR